MKKLPAVIPWEGREIPHGLIEVNQVCNVNCHGCCKDKFNYQKPLEQVFSEIDFLFEQRNLASISLAGGEPTLYQDLPAVIKYVADKGLRSIILTNGSLLTLPLLKAYKKAGLSRIVLHIDSHQTSRPDLKGTANERELNELRKKYVDLCTEADIDAALAVTVYKDTLKQLDEVITWAQTNKNVKFILVTGYSQTVNFKYKSSPADETDTMLTISYGDIVDYMDAKGCSPALYLPSTHNKNALQWIFYMSYLTMDRDNKVQALKFEKDYRMAVTFLVKLQKWIKGRYSFDDSVTSFQCCIGLILYAFLSLSPIKMLEIFIFLSKALMNGNIRPFTLVCQHTPRMIKEGEFEHCYNCPDATVRNNKLVPTCLADYLEPIEQRQSPN